MRRICKLTRAFASLIKPKKKKKPFKPYWFRLNGRTKLSKKKLNYNFVLLFGILFQDVAINGKGMFGKGLGLDWNFKFWSFNVIQSRKNVINILYEKVKSYIF